MSANNFGESNNKLPATRRSFDAELKDGRVIIYTKNYDEFWNTVWTENIIEPERFKELAKKYRSIAAFL